ncbi:MAG: transcriptional repressor LexA [Myxococcota bacterium]
MDVLTDRQQAILDYIRSYSLQNGYPPTLREIGRHFGIRSTNGVNDHLRALEKKGHLARGGMKSRALRPIAAAGAAHGGSANGDGMREIPLFGRVAAGQPILAVESGAETVKVDPRLLGGRAVGELFALRVRGDSMIGDGIFDGDMLFVRRQEAADPGDIVVALIDDEATVKRYRPEGDTLKLVPANPAMQPIVVKRRDLDRVRILGSAVGVYRKL